MANMWDNIKQWRAWAEELRTVADSFTVPSAQRQLRQAADNYDKLASDAEARLAGRPQPHSEDTG